MATMNVSLPDAMKKWVEDRVATGDYGNASDYVRDLIRKDKERRVAFAEMQSEIARGLESGPSGKSFDDIRAEVHRRASRDRAD